MKEKKRFEKLRVWEREIAYASPHKAAKLTRKIVKLKARFSHTGGKA